MISLALVILNVSFLIIPQPKRDIVSIVLFFNATSLQFTFIESTPYFLGPTSLCNSTLKPDVTLILLLVSTCLSLSLLLLQFCCLHDHLPLSRSIHVAFNHRLLYPHHHPLSTFPMSPPASNFLLIALWRGKRFCTTQHPII